MLMYTIRYVHRNNTYYIASNSEGKFIIFESLDSESEWAIKFLMRMGQYLI